MDSTSWILKVIVIVLAVIGLLAVLGVGGMAVMHFGMMGTSRPCFNAMRAWR